jgi:hypothetical protein
LLSEFIQNLLRDGVVRFQDRPSNSAKDYSDAVLLLERAFASHRLEVAGPTIPFDAAVALAATELVCWACWFLVSRTELESELTQRLRMPAVPSIPAHHLSADLMLRYLPQVHRRARALYPTDPLHKILAGVLREWPLSGVLSEVAEGPTVALDLNSHSGLWMLYAERLARQEKPGWFPSGPGLDYVELVWQELGKDTSLLTRQAAVGKKV